MKRWLRIAVTAVMALTLLFLGSVTALAETKNIKKSLFNMTPVAYSKTTYGYDGSSDTPEGLCITGNVIYTTKLHQDTHKTTVIKTVLNKDGTSKNIMPAKLLSIGHANDMTYYNGYLYTAGLDKKFYRIKDEGLDKNGHEKYSVKAYTVSGISVTANWKTYASTTWNITHFTGKYFIFCSAINTSLKFTFRIGYFDDSTAKFVVTKTFYGYSRQFAVLQGIAYRKGILYMSTSDNSGTFHMNKISEFNIGATYKGVTANKSYTRVNYGTFDDLTASKYEIEAFDFDSSGKMYVLMNVSGKKDPIYVSKKAIA